MRTMKPCEKSHLRTDCPPTTSDCFIETIAINRENRIVPYYTYNLGYGGWLVRIIHFTLYSFNFQVQLNFLNIFT